MAETSLKIDVDVDGARKIDALERKIAKLDRRLDKLGRNQAKMLGKTSQDTERSLSQMTKKWTKHFDDLDSLIKKFGTFTMGALKLAIKAAGAEMVLMGLSMVALHGLFAAGQGLVKTYEGLLNVLSGAASGAAVALASVAAAMREHQAAMFAFRGNAMGGYDRFVTGVNKVRVVMRGLHTDQTLVAAGAANLDAAFAAVSRSSTFTRGSQGLLRGLMDFASTGDLKAGMTQAGELIAALQDPKKGLGEIRGIADKMGKPMQDAIKKANVTSKKQLMDLITSGELAVAGGVGGQWEAVTGTLISRFKAAMVTIKSDFADLGQEFLEPLKLALDHIIQTFRSGMTRVWVPLVEFGRGPFLASLTGFAEKTTDLFVNFVRRGPEVEGMFERMGNRWKGFVDGWNEVLDKLRPMIDGARILEASFGNLFGAIGDYIAGSFGTFNKALQDNEAEVLKFGMRLGELFAAFGNFQNELKELFFRALPFINKILAGVKMIVDLLTNVMRTAGGMLGGLGDGAGAYGLLAGAMVILSRLRAWAGGFLMQKQTNTMNVTAGTVNVGGAPMGGGPGAATGITPGGQMYPGGSPSGMRAQRAGFVPMNAQQRAMAEQRAAGSMSWRQRQGSNMRAVGMAGGQGGTMWQRTVGHRLRAMREPSARMRGRMTGTTGRLGMGMGLGMLSPLVGEESQGMMGLGAMASFINPLVGAGIAGLGTAATSQNAMHATLGGALGGGAAGMQLAGPWGALGGAIVGAAYGWMMAGGRKEAAKREKAKEAGAAIATIALESITESIGKRAEHAGASTLLPEPIRKALDPMRSLRDRLVAVKGKSTTDKRRLLRELEDDPMFKAAFDPYGGKTSQIEDKNVGHVLAAAQIPLQRYVSEIDAVLDHTEANIGTLSTAFGVTDEAILDMAHTTETELYSATAGWGAMAIALSKSLVQNQREMQYAAADRRAISHRDLTRQQNATRAPLIMDEAGQAINDILKTGNVTPEDQISILENIKAIDNSAAALMGSDTAGARAMMTAFGAGGSAYQAGGVFEGREAALRNMPGFTDWQGSLQTSVTQQKVDASETLFAQLTQAGIKGVSLPGLREQLAGTSMTQLEGSGMLTAGALYNEDGTLKELDVIQAMLANLGVTATLKEMTVAELQEPADTFDAAVTKFVEGINKFVIEFGGAPTDTMTPRRGMVGMRSKLGKLGSSQSDHLYGGAYDTYGSGLGALQSEIRNAGGYADMHGVSRNRHLHAVPGSGDGGGTSNNYTINVVGGDNATPSDIADEVMDRITRRSVDVIERS